jgi:hypothetical protein
MWHVQSDHASGWPELETRIGLFGLNTNWQVNIGVDKNMAVTPLTANAKLTIFYHVGPLTHKMDFLCNITHTVLALITGWSLDTQSAVVLDVVTALANLTPLIAAIMPTEGVLDTWELYQFTGGVYNPVVGGSIGTSGGDGAAHDEVGRMTAVYRISAGVKLRFVLLGSNIPTPQHTAMGALTGATAALINDFLNSANPHAGSWVRNRSAGFIASGTYITTSLDRKSRRREGLV